jgi:hypothetical protein
MLTLRLEITCYSETLVSTCKNTRSRSPTLRMETGCYSETFVSTYKNTWCQPRILQSGLSKVMCYETRQTGFRTWHNKVTFHSPWCSRRWVPPDLPSNKLSLLSLSLSLSLWRSSGQICCRLLILTGYSYHSMQINLKSRRNEGLNLDRWRFWRGDFEVNQLSQPLWWTIWIQSPPPTFTFSRSPQSVIKTLVSCPSLFYQLIGLCRLLFLIVGNSLFFYSATVVAYWGFVDIAVLRYSILCRLSFISRMRSVDFFSICLIIPDALWSRGWFNL